LTLNSKGILLLLFIYKISNGMKTYKLRENLTQVTKEELASYPELTQELLFARGINKKEQAEIFLNPSYEEHTHDPFEILGMGKAVERILKAIKNNEVICIYTDYDHDGIPGGVILYDFFKKIGYQNFVNYIPHRYLEGYGLNTKAVETLYIENKVTLMITVDCGITDIDPVGRANALGMDIIISDHHLPAEIGLPPAFAILNSKQENCDYPYDMLCGAAVAFKLVQALIARGKFNISLGWEKWLLDLVGLSTIADMVPLTGENRVLAYFGLKVLRKSPRPGLLKLMRLMNMKQYAITEDDIGFMIAPRINAASRMGNPRLAFDLLTSLDAGNGETIARELQKLNDMRKGVVAGMIKEMKHTLSLKDELLPVLVMGNPHWRPGLLGLAASNLSEEHGRPVFLWGREGGENLKGSCRSDGSVDVVKLMAAVSKNVLTDFGGHAMAGGFAANQEEVHTLEQEINKAYEKVKQKDFVEIFYIDKKLVLDDVSQSNWREIERLAPFGIGNQKPIFIFENIIPEKARMFGKTKEHLELTFRKTDGEFVRAIEFFSSRIIKDNTKINLVANFEKSTFGKYPEIRLRIIDVL